MKIIKYAVGIIAVLILIVIGGGYYFIQMRLPLINGEVKLTGLEKEVEIIRDKWGVPHIFAQNEKDMFFAQGYCQAQDRLFQMDFVRRVGRGRLAEILGPDLVETDHFLRVLSVMWPEERAEKALPPEHRWIFDAYTAGVNEFIRSHQNSLPLEFTILGYKPEPWKVTDWVYVVLYMGWDLNTGWKGDLVLMKLIDKVGKERAEQAMPSYPGGGPTIVPAGEWQSSELLPLIYPFDRLAENLSIHQSTPGGSNAWVLSGKKTTTGRPILCNDPHLGLTSPSIWYELHLKAGNFDVAGVTLPGVPGVLIGNNRDIAWGFTNVMLDDMDFYIEKINPENANQYMYKGQWEDMKTIREVIKVKGGESVIKEIKITRHGPIINDVHKGLKHSLAMRWNLNDGLGWVEGIIGLDRARSWEEFTDSVGRIFGPGQNIVYADKEGNIGFYTAGRIPLRANKGEGALPMPGWNGKHEWRGYVPFKENPHLFNPKSGYIVEANNQTAPDDYPHYIGRNFVAKYRAERIVRLIEKKDKLSIADNRNIQNDIYVLEAAEIMPVIIEALDGIKEKDAETQKATEFLRTWDFISDEDSVACTIFHVLQMKLIRNIFLDELGGELFNQYLRATTNMSKGFQLVMSKKDSPWFEDVSTPMVNETRADIIRRSAKEALFELREKFGDDMGEWRWGKLHEHRSNHYVFKKVKYLDKFFNIGPFSLSGSKHTVAPAAYKYHDPYISSHGASTREIIDFSNPGNNIRVITTGCSGHFNSEFFDNQSKLWRKGEYHPVLMDKKDVEKNAEGTLKLKPH